MRQQAVWWRSCSEGCEVNHKKESLSSFAKTLSGFVPSPRYFAKPSEPLTRLFFSSAPCAVDGNTKCKQRANLARRVEHGGKLLHLNPIYSGNDIVFAKERAGAGMELTNFVTVNRSKLSKFVVASEFGTKTAASIRRFLDKNQSIFRRRATHEGFSGR
jgi:hypothetical protein